MKTHHITWAGSRRTRFALGATVIAAALALSGCTAESGGGEGDSDTPIVIGGTLGLTGTFSAASVGYEAAYQYWEDEINANGGLLGRPVEIKIYDDESTPATAQQLYQRLINEDNVDLLLAPYTTGVGGAIVPITERAGKILFNPGFLSKELHSTSKLMVSTWPYQEPEAAGPIFDYIESLPEDQRPKTLAVATGQFPFLLAARDGFQGEGGVLNRAKDLGIDVVLNEEYDLATTDFTGLTQQIADADADMFVGLSLVNDASLLATSIYQSGYDPDFYCSCGSQVTTQPNWADLGDAGLNIYSTANAWSNQDNPGLADLTEAMNTALGTDLLPGYASVAYAALQVLQQSVEATNSLDDQTLRDYIGESSFDTALGTISYNADGTTKGVTPLLVQYQADGNQVIGPKETATADAVIPYRS